MSSVLFGYMSVKLNQMSEITQLKHVAFVLPFMQIYSPWLKWNFQHKYILETPNWAVIGFQAQFVPMNMKARGFEARRTSSSTQTVNQTARERMGEYKPLTFPEVLLLAIWAPPTVA